MGFEVLQSPKLNRLIFVLYILVILVITVSTPSQKLTTSPNTMEPAFSVPEGMALVPGTPEMQAQGALNATETPGPAMDPDPLMVQEASPTPQTTPAVAARQAIPGDLHPPGYRYEFRDNLRKQVVSVSLRDFSVMPQYSYFYDDPNAPDLVTVSARPGYKFVLVGITWDLIGVVGEGSRTVFVTPGVASYKLVHDGRTYDALDPNSIENPLDLYILSKGSLLMSRSIDKDNPGSGVLIFETPSDLRVKDAWLEFCPKNEGRSAGRSHTPDNWDCRTKTIRWSLSA
jgi:hypothetical protein